MTARPEGSLCRGTRPDGTPCRAFGRRPDGFCPWHRPDTTQAHHQLTLARARLRDLRDPTPSDPAAREVIRFRVGVRGALIFVRRLTRTAPGTPLADVVHNLDRAIDALQRTRRQLAADHPGLAAADRDDEWRRCVV